MMAQCRRCGSTIVSGARYCSSCGETIPPDPNLVRTRELVEVRPLVDPAVSGQGRTRELATRGARVVPSTAASSGRQALLITVAALAFAGLGLVAFLGRHADDTATRLGSNSAQTVAATASVPASWALNMLGPAASLEALCTDLRQNAQRRAGISDSNELAFGCELDPTLDGLRTTGISGDTWEEVHFVRTGTSDAGQEGHVRLGIRTRLGWFLSDAVVSLAAGRGRNEATELRLFAEELAPTSGAELSAIASHRFVDVDAVTGQKDELEQTFRVACALVSGAPDCLRVRTRWRATKLAAGRPGSNDVASALAVGGSEQAKVPTPEAPSAADASESFPKVELDRASATRRVDLAGVEEPEVVTPEDGAASRQGGELQLAFVDGIVTATATPDSAESEHAVAGVYRWHRH